MTLASKQICANGRFIKGHEVPDEWREKFRIMYKGKHSSPRTEFKKGHKTWNKGRAWPEGFRKRMSIIQKHNSKLLNHPNVKKFQFKKSSIPWNKNRKNIYSKEVIEKIREGWFKKGERFSPKTEFKKGFIPWNKGKPWPEEFRKRMSESRKAYAKNNPEFLKRILTFRRPNKTEEILDSWLQSYFPKEFVFVGNGSFIIEGLNPDWVGCGGKRQIIELFGEPWHKPEEEQLRKNRFAKFGYHTLVIWYEELKDKKSVLGKIQNFIEAS
jgi:Ni/Co efflux regulator RcnB